MTGRKAARNVYSRNTNKIGIRYICWFYSQGTLRWYTVWGVLTAVPSTIAENERLSFPKVEVRYFSL